MWIFWWPTNIPSFSLLFWVRASCSALLLFLPIRTYFPQVCMWIYAQVSTAGAEILGYLCSYLCFNSWSLLWPLKFLWLLKTILSCPSSILFFLHLLSPHIVYVLPFFFNCIICLPKLMEGRNSVFSYISYRLSNFVCWINE